MVSIAVYSYFLLTLVSRQYIISGPDSDPVDLYLPFFTMIEFTVMIGWMKVRFRGVVLSTSEDPCPPLCEIFSFFFLHSTPPFSSSSHTLPSGSLFRFIQVGQQMMCPFSDDDDDFECLWLIQRNVEISQVFLSQYNFRPSKRSAVTHCHATTQQHTHAVARYRFLSRTVAHHHKVSHCGTHNTLSREPSRNICTLHHTRPLDCYTVSQTLMMHR